MRMRRFGVAGVALVVVGSVGVMPAAASGGWTIQPTPNPTGSTSTELFGVSCGSATTCTTVGTYTKNGGPIDVSVAEGWNGTIWAVQSTPNPKQSTGTFLLGVSCPSSVVCMAVGYSTDTFGDSFTLAERWNGTRWAIVTTQDPGIVNLLSGVSCTSAIACTATGMYQNAVGLDVTLAERWDGTSWAVQTTPNPTGATFSDLVAVSCRSTNACTAVGNAINSAGARVTLAEHWNGTAWAIQTTRNPTGATLSDLMAVSCTSATACTATGTSDHGTSNPSTLAERLSPTGWAIQTTPNPSGTTFSDLTGVSCTSATACTATGISLNSTAYLTLAEQWNGTSWAIQATPTPSGATRVQVAGVSCTSTTVCTTAGNYRSTTDFTLVLRSS